MCPKGLVLILGEVEEEGWEEEALREEEGLKGVPVVAWAAEACIQVVEVVVGVVEEEEEEAVGEGPACMGVLVGEGVGHRVGEDS